MKELAEEYFKIGNGIVAFYVVQTFLFLHALYKEPKLKAALCAKRTRSNNVTWSIACVYIVLILGCGVAEIGLRSTGQASAVIIAAAVAIPARIGVVLALAWGCSQLIMNYLKPESDIADQPATAADPKAGGKVKPTPESEGRSE